MSKLELKLSFWGLLVASFLVSSCKSTDNSILNPTSTNNTDITSVVQSKFLTNKGVTISVNGASITIKSDGRPNNHKSPYWGVGNALYEPMPSGHVINPNKMVAQNYSMTIPTQPTAASSHEATGLGAIGMALNGVAIFNDQEGPNTALDAGKISSLDASGAHPEQTGAYHYHVTGVNTTTDDANLVGFLRDGFPLYGRKDKDGSYPSNLDTYGGHTGATAEFPNGIYHYHTSNINYLNTGYYILKSGSYYGTKGTFTN
ncbi:YHYH protein [Emticicia sp. 17c]|uniref:YHYH protein n=1 Tax=Emticicia sp. 17c TaxID=3127704 RepID=UPI00301DFF5B